MYLENLFSISQTESMIDSIEVYQPEYNENGVIQPLYLDNEEVSLQVVDKISKILPEICNYYGSQPFGIETVSLEWLPCGAQTAVKSENSTLMNNKWVKTQNRDLTGVLFLNSHVDAKDIDEFESMDCCGGKLQFINYNFGFLPQAGDVVIYPSDARFANNTAKVIAGDLYQVRFHIVTKTPYIHDITKFPGTYVDWF